MIKIHPMFYKTAAVASAGVFSYIYLYAIGHALHESALHKKKYPDAKSDSTRTSRFMKTYFPTIQSMMNNSQKPTEVKSSEPTAPSPSSKQP